MFSSSGISVCFFSSFLLFRVMCVRYLMVDFEKVSINLLYFDAWDV